MTKTKDYSVEISTLVAKLMELLGIEVKVDVEKEKSEDEAYKVTLTASEDMSGLLIGSKGMTLEAIQSFLGVAIKQLTDVWVRITVDVAGWRDKQSVYLEDLAEQTASRARTTGEPQNLYNLTAAQRRVIHLKLANEKDIETVSEGEGMDRYLVIRLK